MIFPKIFFVNRAPGLRFCSGLVSLKSWLRLTKRTFDIHYMHFTWYPEYVQHHFQNLISSFTVHNLLSPPNFISISLQLFCSQKQRDKQINRGKNITSANLWLLFRSSMHQIVFGGQVPPQPSSRDAIFSLNPGLKVRGLEGGRAHWCSGRLSPPALSSAPSTTLMLWARG